MIIIGGVISWNEDGTTFIVWRPAEFARDLLPKFFGSEKVDVSPRSIREEQVLSSNSSPSTSLIPPVMMANNIIKYIRPSVNNGGCSSTNSELVEENERLRKENRLLSQELKQMKNLCNNIFALMTKYKASTNHHGEEAEDEQDKSGGGGGNGFPVGKTMEFLSLKRFYTSSTRLFGVPIRVKRARTEDDENEEPVKPEPSDSNSKKVVDDESCFILFLLVPCIKPLI
ncbi:hypothetical protein MKX03_011219 [Papaver bracteatum]|nr:hypothetical protein MKX03_011219 [Papaver bracteatum]